MSRYHRILVPLDDSVLGERALDSALATAAWSKCGVVLLRWTASPVDFEAAGDDVQTDIKVMHQEIDELLALAKARMKALELPEIEVTAEVRGGKLVDTIVDAAEDLSCDLVVMGSQGRKGLADHLLGSTTEQVMKRTACSVFVVRTQGYPYLRT